MIIKLSRTSILIITICIIAAYLLLNRFDAIHSRETVIGEITKIKKERSGMTRDILYFAELSYRIGSTKYRIELSNAEDMKVGDKLELIYDTDYPEDATTYDFKGFWMGPIMYCIIPLLFLSAFILAFIDKTDVISFNFKNGLKIRKSKKISNDDFNGVIEPNNELKNLNG